MGCEEEDPDLVMNSYKDFQAGDVIKMVGRRDDCIRNGSTCSAFLANIDGHETTFDKYLERVPH